jgi:hypothetical protein
LSHRGTSQGEVGLPRNPTVSAEPVPAPVRNFIRDARGFSVAVAIGLAPLLGTVNLPLFRPLAALLPFQIRDEVTIVTAFIMGIVALAAEFYAADRMSRRTVRRRFAYAAAGLLVGLGAFTVTSKLFTTTAPTGPNGRDVVRVLIGPQRLDSCTCRKELVSDAACVQTLVLEESAVEQCWGRQTGRALLLELCYVIAMAGFGALVGIYGLRRRLRRAAGQPPTSGLRAPRDRARARRPRGSKAESAASDNSGDRDVV